MVNEIVSKIKNFNFKEIKDKMSVDTVAHDDRNSFSRYVRIFWGLYALGIVFLLLFFALVAGGSFGPLPGFDELENPQRNIASEIWASDQQLLGKYYLENRTIVNFNEISPILINSLVATEDIRFYDHSGIDMRGIGRVFFKTVLLRQDKGGGSTITQQLAKNLFPRDTANSSGMKLFGKLVMAKFKEWVTAVRLERNYTKDEIIVMYLNTVPFGSQSFGIKSAARTFFNTSPDSLRLEEAAMLVGIVQAPSFLSPKRHPDRAIARRNTVLNQMRKYDFITRDQFDSLTNMEVKLNFNVRSHNEGLSTYFREYLRTLMGAKKPEREEYGNYSSYQEDSTDWADNPLYGWCWKNLKPDGSPYDLYKDGLKIHTTINSKMQSYAEWSMAQHMGGYLQPIFDKYNAKLNTPPFDNRLPKEQVNEIIYRSIQRSERYRNLRKLGLDSTQIMANFKKPIEMEDIFRWKRKIDSTDVVCYEQFDTIMSPYDSLLYYKKYFRAGFVSMEPQTGYVRAYVGGINYKHFKYDHVMVARRQVGSTFKPFLYNLAMLGGLSPCYQVPNISWSIEMPDGQPLYTPQLSPSKRKGEMVTLKYGLANSLNQISAWLMRQYTPQAAVDIARKMGVRSHIDPVASICVGSAEVKLSEMVAAYSTYANKGFYSEPLLVTHIEDKNGNVIATFSPKKQQAMSEEIAYLMIDLMKGVVNMGTGIRLRLKYKITNEIAGKTGTTNNNSDAWFIGITPKLVNGVWVGGEERSIHFSSTDLGQGANAALPIWAMFMKKVYGDKSLGILPEDKFERPLRLPVETDCQQYDRIDLNELIQDDDEII